MIQKHATAPLRLAELPAMTLAQLRVAWDELMAQTHPRRRTAAPQQRSILIREIAWRLQERDLPDRALDPATQRLLAAAIRSAEEGRVACDAAPRSRPRLATATPSNRLGASSSLPSMSRLVRVYRGVTHEVTVLDDPRRFRYRGRDYRSLSAITREIVGTNRSGPGFFGLTTLAAPEHARASGDDA